MQYSEPVVFHNQTRLQSRNEINTQTEHFGSKTQQFTLIEKLYLVLNEEEKHSLDGENSKKVEWQHDIGLRNFA